MSEVMVDVNLTTTRCASLENTVFVNTHKRLIFRHCQFSVQIQLRYSVWVVLLWEKIMDTGWYKIVYRAYESTDTW